tara:strand:- start:22 stop:234 length:213 start_codon:yes stop_codon:yes gene_type:complete
MVKTLIIMILLFNGEVVLEKYDLSKSMKIHECLIFSDKHRESISTYKGDGMEQGWYLNDGRGTIQGFICE